MIFILTTFSAVNLQRVFFQAGGPSILIQNSTVAIVGVVVLILLCLLLWGLHKWNTNRLKALEKTLKQKARDLEQSEERYRQLVEQITAVTYVDDVDYFRSTIFISPQIEKLCGYRPDEWKSDPQLWFNIIHPEDRDRVIHENTLTNKTKRPFKLDYRIIAKDGKTVWVHDEAVLTEIGGRKVWHGVMYDITERKQLEETLRYISNHDVLTGLYNRTYYNEELLRLQKGRHFPVSIIVGDIDDLKGINDRYGHGVGDRLIKQAARLFESVFRQGDVIARTGGDEFIILLPQTNEATAIQCTLRIREILNKKANEQPHLSLSFGTATATRGTSFTKLMKSADDQMYQEKAEKKLRQDMQISSNQISLIP
jgi:diguanylate cyclase (GGDEF)-like protein/PAS domain S-box-containing protein